MTRVDAYAGSRALLENAFSYLTWHEKACKEAGFKGISPVWKDEPAWYFWLDAVPGAFLLRLHDEEPLHDGQYVSFTVHYYPPNKAEASVHLSAEELRLLADDRVFDRPTNTPHFEHFETCLPYFVTAEIGMLIAADNRLQLLVYSCEQGMAQPSIQLLDLLVKTLNFAARAHHRKAVQFECELATSLFLAYDLAAFEAFQAHFALGEALFEAPPILDALVKWKKFAHMSVDCSMNGTCSCH